MGKHLDKVIELEYEQIKKAYTKKFDSSQEAALKYGLRERLKTEIKEEILDAVIKDVKKDLETSYEKEKIGNIQTLTSVGVLLSFLVGLAVNQCTECLTLFKHCFPNNELTLPFIFFLILSCLILGILLCFVLKTISNTFSTK